MFQRVVGISVGGTERFSYEYDASGNLARVNNKQNSSSVRYVYDLSDRLVQVIQSSGNTTSFTYDLSNNASVVNEVINGTTFKTTYTYDSDKKLTIVKDSLNFNTAYNYDSFGRLTSKIFKSPSEVALFTTSYIYTDITIDNVEYTSAQLASITNGSSTISYVYDDNGNISSITSGGLVIQYLYDALGQVIRENNQRENITVIYEYDFGGNILSKKIYGYTTGSVDGLTPTDSDTYEYENTNWIDQLTSFNGLTMTYDEIGNIKTYNGKTFNWDKGRQLSSITSAGPTISYTYNDSGIRTSKIVGTTTTSYHLNGDKVTYEKTGNVYSYYTYDSNGQLISINYNGTEYTYIRNGQNDIIGLVDSAGVLVVSYTYSTYGEIVSTTGSLASTLGIANPYRYRGYRYDTETGYYYLQSRYYDPQIGRFISADRSVDTAYGIFGSNTYTYCLNNPANLVDYNGDIPEWLIVRAIYSLLGFAIGSPMQVIHGLTKQVISYYANDYQNKAGLELSQTMFNHAMWGHGGISKKLKMLIINNLKESVEMSSLVANAISNSNGSWIYIKDSYAFNKDIDKDLFAAIHKFNYVISAKKINGHWEVNVTVSDYYDFTETLIHEKGLTFFNTANDLGFIMQNTDLLNPYYWSVSYKMNY